MGRKKRINRRKKDIFFLFSLDDVSFKNMMKGKG